MPQTMYGDIETVARKGVHLLLNYGPVGLIRATLDGLDAQAIWVRTGAVSLECSDRVEILLSLSDGEQTALHRIDAIVDNCQGEAVALSYVGGCTSETMAALEGLIATNPH